VRLAFVVQRYGADVTGGSESLARSVAERLAPRDDVTVFTTCARDYVTWRNEMPEGETSLGGVCVRRFRVEEERDLAAFNAFAEPLYLRATGEGEELEFLRRQGPYAPSLVAALEAERDSFEARVFFTYLYYPTFEGLRRVRERSLLVPTTHDEPPLRFGIFGDLFSRPSALGFLTRPEEALVRSRFDVGGRPTAVLGIGVDAPKRVDVEGFRARHEQGRPFALYAGRIDAGKGCAEMLAFYERYRESTPDPVDLVLIGRLAMEGSLPDGVRYLGFVSEDDKAAAMAAAEVLICPSPFESLSIVLLEGLALGTPVLVTERSAVLVDHCRRSNAGLWYADADEFGCALELLARDARLRDGLGRNGQGYVHEEYRWDAVVERWRGLIARAATSP
jgi:glycosyltransferase involved in cell wall biosynthesis